jgi:hypothetical protein
MRALAVIGAVLASAVITHASNWDETPGQYFARDRGQAVAPSPYGAMPARIKGGNDLALILATTRRMGIPDGLAAKVCKVESGCRINGRPGPMTRHGRHWGAYQTRENVAARFGYSRSEGPLRGMVALKYGAMHLADCYRRADGNEARAAACHVGGPGMVSGARGKYAQRYVQQVANANPAPWAGRLFAMR